MIVPGMFMALAVGFMMLLAMFIPWVDRLESDRVVGLLKRLGEGLVELSGRRGGDCYFVSLNLRSRVERRGLSCPSSRPLWRAYGFAPN